MHLVNAVPIGVLRRVFAVGHGAEEALVDAWLEFEHGVDAEADVRRCPLNEIRGVLEEVVHAGILGNLDGDNAILNLEAGDSVQIGGPESRAETEEQPHAEKREKKAKRRHPTVDDLKPSAVVTVHSRLSLQREDRSWDRPIESRVSNKEC